MRYVVFGAENARTIVFMNGLEIQQMFMRKEPDRKRPWLTGILTTVMKFMPRKLSSRILTGKVTENERRYYY